MSTRIDPSDGTDQSEPVTADANRREVPLAGWEVSCRPLGFFFKQLEKQGRPADLLCEGIPYTRAQLTNAHARMDWTSYRRFLQNLAREWDDEQLVRAGSMLATSRWVQPFGAIARLMFSCDEVYRWTMDKRKGVAKQMISCIENDLRVIGPQRVEVLTSMAPGYEPSREVYQIAIGSLTAMPTVLGLGEARVELHETANGVRYIVDLPRESKVIGNLRRWVTWPFTARTAARKLKEISEQLFERSDELVSESTSRASAEVALQESENRFYKAFHSAPTLMALTSLDGRFIDVNNSFVEASGYSRDEVIGQRALDLGLWQELARRNELVDALARGESLRCIETDMLTREGEPRTGLTSAETLTIDGETCVIWTSADITDRKRAEEENRILQDRMLHAQKLESLGVMAGGIAHDFNNILVGIMGNAELTLGETAPGDEIARNRLQRILDAAQRAADLTREMLAYAGKGQSRTEPVDLAAAVNDTVSLLRSGMPKNKSLRFVEEGVAWVSGDDTQIRQIVMNLMTNAAEAYGDAAGDVDVRVGVVDAETAWLADSFLGGELPAGEYAFVDVRDSGCGMDQETQQKIFDPFYTTKFTGRGLGLAATLGIIKSHGGTLKVDSAPGRGSRFQVLLPRIPAAPLTTGEVPMPSQPRAEGWVLVVDDEAGVRDVARAMLEEAGYRTICADSGSRALTLLRDRIDEIDAVMLDLTMPGMSGEETFEELRRIREALPVVCCSGFGTEVGTEWIEGKSRVKFLAKPFTRRQMLERLDDLLHDGEGDGSA